MSKKKILLVDDSATALLMEKMVLQREAYDLIEARNGEEALDKAKSEHPDLILLDVIMPQLDGFQTCRALRDHAETRNTPVIMVTTRGEPVNIEKGYTSGCTDYVMKPIDSFELLTKIRSYLET